MKASFKQTFFVTALWGNPTKFTSKPFKMDFCDFGFPGYDGYLPECFFKIGPYLTM
jgi:hypothetical protein